MFGRVDRKIAHFHEITDIIAIHEIVAHPAEIPGDPAQLPAPQARGLVSEQA